MNFWLVLWVFSSFWMILISNIRETCDIPSCQLVSQDCHALSKLNQKYSAWPFYLCCQHCYSSMDSLILLFAWEYGAHVAEDVESSIVASFPYASFLQFESTCPSDYVPAISNIVEVNEEGTYFVLCLDNKFSAYPFYFPSSLPFFIFSLYHFLSFSPLYLISTKRYITILFSLSSHTPSGTVTLCS